MPKETALASRMAEPAAVVAASRAAGLLPEVRELILTARRTVDRGMNARLATLRWQVGDRTRRDILGETRAGYADEIVSTLSRQLAWSDRTEIGHFKHERQRDFYPETCHRDVESRMMCSASSTCAPSSGTLSYGRRSWSSLTPSSSGPRRTCSEWRPHSTGQASRTATGRSVRGSGRRSITYLRSRSFTGECRSLRTRR
jgi:hypothetical protein